MIDIMIQHGNLGHEYVRIGLVEFNQYKKRLEDKEIKHESDLNRIKYYGYILDNGVLFQVVLTHKKGYNARMTVSSWALVYGCDRPQKRAIDN